MQTYNRIMLYFWLIIAVVIFVFVTYMSITDGIKKWGFYYLFVVTSLGTFFFKKWMMNRMEKHAAFLEEKRQKEHKKH
jgi:hypothetical protein